MTGFYSEIDPKVGFVVLDHMSNTSANGSKFSYDDVIAWKAFPHY